jgi:hypothetical protein
VARPEKFELPAPRFEVKVDCVAQGISGPVKGDKPKWMRWRTFERLAAEHNAFVDESLARMALRFGIKF